ncbi:MAG: hypothetical protein F4Y14_05645 [Acidobacteria bacterium]|nr:hypothetical protein [Acidobacteriota bacterium]
MSLFRIPIRGWNKCVHEAVAFDSRGEYAVACLLDDAATVAWWVRNDPAIFRIPTPIGNFEPDFVYFAQRGSQPTYGILEVKSDVFWDGPGSDARVKANAAKEWVRTVNAAGATVPWEFAIVLDQDAIEAASVEALRNIALDRHPDAIEATGLGM